MQSFVMCIYMTITNSFFITVAIVSKCGKQSTFSEQVWQLQKCKASFGLTQMLVPLDFLAH